MEFREGDFDEEDDFFFAMKEIGIRKNDLKITDQEMMALWMFQHQILREVIKKEAHKMADIFEEKYKELKIEGKRKKTLESYHMGLESISRQIY